MNTAASPGWLTCGSTGSSRSHLSFKKGQESIPLLLPCASRAKTEEGEGNRRRPWGEASPAADRRLVAAELLPGPRAPTRSCSPADGAPRRPGHGGRYPRRRRLRRLGAETKWRHGMGVMRCIPPGGLSLPYDGSWQPGHTRRLAGATAAGGGALRRPNRVSGTVGEVRLRPRKVTAVAAWVEGGCSGDGHGARARPWRVCSYCVLRIRGRWFGSGGVNGRLRRG